MFDPKFFRVCSSLVAAVFVTAAASAPSPAGADDATATMSTFVCRESLPSEAPTAKMVNSPTTLVCRPLVYTIRGEDGTMRTIGTASAKVPLGPDLSKALTPQQFETAYSQWLERTLKIDPQIIHSP